MPRYGSTSCDGNGRTAALAPLSGQAFERRQEERDVGDRLSRSPSPGTTYEDDAVRQRMRGRRHEQRLGGGRQARDGARPSPVPLRATALLSSAEG